MFPEMLEEFQSSQYPSEIMQKMEEIDTDEDKKNFEYELDLEYPYGTFEASIFFKNKHFQGEEEVEHDLKPLADSEKQFVFQYFEPKPISTEEQKQLDIAEEEENKRREHEARMAQKKLEEEKAKLKYEK
jgi:hypothetical protein